MITQNPEMKTLLATGFIEMSPASYWSDFGDCFIQGKPDADSVSSHCGISEADPSHLRGLSSGLSSDHHPKGAMSTAVRLSCRNEARG